MVPIYCSGDLYPSMMRRRTLLLAGLGGLMVLAAVVSVRFVASRPRATAATFVGARACARCHAAQYQSWRASQQAVAMQDARGTAVLGQFDSTRFTSAGITSVFFRRGDRYVVNTEGEDGLPHDYEIRYTFGVWPLQQYLVELTRGRVQALRLAWDARAAVDGGQRWFSLDLGVRVGPNDQFHWTGPENNWNYMCADCHSTAVRKGYDARDSTYHTTYAEIDVACESCHGPASEHVRWADGSRWWRGADDGVRNRLTERQGVRWIRDSAAPTAYRSTPRATDREIETCAQCHARRSHIADGYTAGAPLLDYYLPLLLFNGLYHSDGQQEDEVFTYGSFLQSKMYAAGVTCSDCHDPHSGKLRLSGNAVCAQCHRSAKYDTPEHHFHKVGSTGSTCVSCHMPDSAFMLIDRRHDHSMRVPRPDLSVTLGVPNPCTRCHSDRDAGWAAAKVRTWYGHVPSGYQHFATAFAADDRGDPHAADSLVRVLDDSTQPPFVRASALARLAGHPGPIALEHARARINDSHPLMRLAALQVLETVAPSARMVAIPLLRDSLRTVRQSAAWVLAPVSASIAGADRRAFERAASEFIDSQEYNADRPMNRQLLAAFYIQLRDTAHVPRPPAPNRNVP